MRDRRLATGDRTASDWSDWLRQCRGTREQVYRADPDEVTANYDREVAHVRDYHGREVLELMVVEDPPDLRIVLSH